MNNVTLAVIGCLVFIAAVAEPASPPKKPEFDPDGICLVMGDRVECIDFKRI